MKPLKSFYFYHLLLSVFNFSIISADFRIISTKFQKKNDHFSIHLKNWCCLYTNLGLSYYSKYFDKPFKNCQFIRFYLLFFLRKSYKYLMIILHNLTNFKGTSSGLRQFLATESPLKRMKNAFYFTLKPLFVFKIFRFLSWLFGHVEKQLN